jgi:hypothetical protein
MRQPEHFDLPKIDDELQEKNGQSSRNVCDKINALLDTLRDNQIEEGNDQETASGDASLDDS